MIIDWRKLSGLLLLAASAAPLGAEECSAPCLDYSFSTDFEAEWAISKRDPDREGVDVSASGSREFTFKPVDPFKLVTEIVSEPVLDRDPGENRFFGDTGLYVAQLYGEAEFEPLTLRAGKFDPQFGLATDTLDGFFATDLVGDYDNDERLGGEAALAFEAMGLAHAITASAFTTDRTVLSESLFTNRGRTRLSQGGAGNSDGISSFVVLLDGCHGAAAGDCYDDGKFGYRMGFRHQEAGNATEEQIDEGIVPKDEQAFLAAVTGRRELGEMVLRGLGEVAYIRNFEGGPDDALIGTAGLEIEKAPMTYIASASAIRNMIAGAGDTAEYLIDLTAKYDFDEDFTVFGEAWSVAASYGLHRDEEGRDNHLIAMKLSLQLDGSLGGEEK